MSFLKRYAAVFFKQDHSTTVFYPRGALGKGVQVTEEQREHLEKTIIRYMAASFVVALVQIMLQPILGVRTALAVVALPYVMVCCVYWWSLRSLTRGLPTAGVRTTFHEVAAKIVALFPRWLWHLLLALNFIMFVGSLVLLALTISHSGSSIWTSAGVVLFGISGGLCLWYWHIASTAERRSNALEP